MTLPDLHIETVQRPPVKRALLIALQYPSLKGHELKYTYKDAENIHNVLIDLFHFQPENITVLKDDGLGISPTRDVILDHMRKLVGDSIPGDRFVFHFSGHGDQRENGGNDTEVDGKDETIWPADVHVDDNDNVTNDIVDDLVGETLVKPVCVDARLVIIFDSCHSGTAADLDYWLEDHKDFRAKKYRPSRRSNALNLTKNAQAWSPVTSTASGKGSPNNVESALDSINDVVNRPETPRIVSWAACRDPQTTGGLPNYGGLFVKVFTDTLRQIADRGQAFTHGDFLKELEDSMIKTVRDKFDELRKKSQGEGKVKHWTEEELRRIAGKPQLLGLPNLVEVKNFLIDEMF